MCKTSTHKKGLLIFFYDPNITLHGQTAYIVRSMLLHLSLSLMLYIVYTVGGGQYNH